MLELYVYMFVILYVIYVTLWPLEEWYSLQKASTDLFLCHKEHLYNECKLCDILIKDSFLVKNVNRHMYLITALFV